MPRSEFPAARPPEKCWFIDHAVADLGVKINSLAFMLAVIAASAGAGSARSSAKPDPHQNRVADNTFMSNFDRTHEPKAKNEKEDRRRSRG